MVTPKSDIRKIKVKIIRTQQVAPEEDDSEDDLPPPPPPPGSPPPHLWPPRVKPINNVHPQIPTSIYPPSPFPQTVLYPPAFPPQPAPRHHMPALPMQQSGMHMHGGPSMVGGVPPQHLGPHNHGPPHPPFHPHRLSHPD